MQTKKTVQLLILSLLLIATFGAQAYIDKKIKPTQQENGYNILLSLPPHIVRNITFGYNNFIADVIWLDFIQYFGQEFKKKWYDKRTDYDFSKCPTYANLIATLDPHFEYAYWFLGFAIADEGENPDWAIRFVKKGAETNKHSWKLPYSVAIMEMMYRSDLKSAARYIDLAVQASDAPPFLKKYQAIIHSRIHNRDKAIQLWIAIYKESLKQEDSMNIERAQRNLLKLGVDPSKLTVSSEG